MTQRFLLARRKPAVMALTGIAMALATKGAQSVRIPMKMAAVMSKIVRRCARTNLQISLKFVGTV
jgi:hypothetical protein